MNAPAATPTYRAAVVTAWIAGVFVLGVAGLMLFQRFTAASSDPWKSPQLLELKEQLRAAPKDERIKERIRELDLRFRQRYVRRLALVHTGGWLLLGGSVVLVAALTTVAAARRQAPRPLPEPGAGDRAQKETAQSRRAVIATGAVTLGAMLTIAATMRTPPGVAAPAAAGGPEKSGAAPGPGAVPAANPAAAPELPPQSEFFAQWPRFLGPTGSSVAATADAPLQWDGAAGAGVLWKAEVPAPGFNSPVVWGDRLFLSGGTREKREVFCYDTTAGRLLWRTAIEKLPGSPPRAPEISDQTGYAAPTMATDGRHAYVIFPTGDLAALTFTGTVAWAKHLGVPKNLYGHSTSLAIWQGRLIVQYDQGESAPANSKLLAFDGATGRVIWEKPREIASTWASPIVIEAAGKTQIITLGEPNVIAYDWSDGRELWKAHVLEGEVTPSPAFAGGLVLVINPYNRLLALAPDGSGDVTESHVKWKAEDNIPDVTSPVSDGEVAFTVTSGGALMCFDLKTGAKIWEHDLKTEIQATPVIAGKRLYVLAADGTMIVAEVGRAFKELARNALGEGEKFVASPAFVRGRIYVRGLTHLYCLGEAPAKPAAP
jgi:outer membrane protein assembly factor BamB